MTKKTPDRATLQTELTAKQAELATLMSELAGFTDISGQMYASAHPQAPRQGEVRRLIGAVEAKIATLQNQISLADKSDSFDTAGAVADDEIKRAQVMIADAADAAAKLLQRRSQVVAKADHFRSAAATHLELARAAEQIALTAYARAVSDGEESAQARAQDDVATAQTAVAEAQRQGAAQSAVIAALDAEVAALDQELAAVGDRAEAARTSLGTALRALYASQWDRAVDAIEQLAARYCQTFKMVGSEYRGFSRVEIPRLDPTRGRVYLDRVASVELPEVDQKTREHLASLFNAAGRRIFASNKAA